MTSTVRVASLKTTVTWPDSSRTELSNLWLRDNCSCCDCRVVQTSEKKFLISSVAADIKPKDATLDCETLVLTWPDGHISQYSQSQLVPTFLSTEFAAELWGRDFVPSTVDYQSFLDVDRIAAGAITEFLKSGALVITSMPGTSGTLEHLRSRLGPLRELPFARIHEVLVDAKGYNVAHTSLSLPPHNDFASTNWPPSIQALHMLVNECEGGASIIVDGWAVAEQLRIDHPDLFEVLCRVPVPFRMFSEQEDTLAINPIVRVDAEGKLAHLRYSNQLMQTLDPLMDGVHEFYQAYHELTRRLTSENAKAVFRLESEQCLLVAGHRVLHAREGFKPTGKRHLQDAYFEHEFCRNHLGVLQRTMTHPINGVGS